MLMLTEEVLKVFKGLFTPQGLIKIYQARAECSVSETLFMKLIINL